MILLNVNISYFTVKYSAKPTNKSLGIQLGNIFLNLFFKHFKKEVVMTLVKSNRTRSNGLPALFDDFFNRELFDWGQSNFSNTGTTLPAVNIKETTENFLIEMAAPGMSKSDFKVELEGSLLTITSEKRSSQEEEMEDEKYTRKEFSYETFQRTFNLPREVVDTDKIDAKYKDGVLQLVIPKKEEAKQKPPRLIQIA